MDCHFRDLPNFQSSEARLMTNEWQNLKMTVHKKLLIKLKVLNQIWWSWCYYNEEKMLYPARWKKITVDQSKVLKNQLYRLLRFYLGPPGIKDQFAMPPVGHNRKPSLGRSRGKLKGNSVQTKGFKSHLLQEIHTTKQEIDITKCENSGISFLCI